MGWTRPISLDDIKEEKRAEILTTTALKDMEEAKRKESKLGIIGVLVLAGLIGISIIGALAIINILIGF